MPSRFEGDQSSSQKQKDHERQHNCTHISPSPANQPGATSSHQELRKDFQSVLNQSNILLTPICGNQLTNKPNKTPDVPKTRE
ncbi:hypothetical protein OnM2_047081 [Erysiphe neolycopersici]|uniref:Uncharacterized protein n=1 Tax=Erysiphe neolycopersici TaxID=212602 RepID=A0A420HTQ2_9PEZI|nr:hypothetical protein OnM2_047081 [Erysiphe neolycopersici]